MATKKTAAPASIVRRLLDYNANRIPSLLAVKFKNMRANPFTFFRGSCHLFFEDWPKDLRLNSAPPAWACGDLHLENFGSYRGSNRLVYFDINDFDESALAPCTWDAARFLTSLILAGELQKLPQEAILGLCQRFLDGYFSSLAEGHIRSVERANASGLIKKLIRRLKNRERREFLDERSRKLKTTRKFRSGYSKFLPATADEQQLIVEILQTLAALGDDVEFYRLHDSAFRIAGTGSLGIPRYAALIEGAGFPDKNFILDIKEARASALAPFLKTPQPAWENQAQRIVTIQKRMLGMPPALLTSVEARGRAFLVKEYQPQEDRLNLVEWAGKLPPALELSTSMGEILAWGQLRASGRQGAATADDLMDFGGQGAFKKDLLEYAIGSARHTHESFDQYTHAYDQGLLTPPGLEAA